MTGEDRTNVGISYGGAYGRTAGQVLSCCGWDFWKISLDGYVNSAAEAAHPVKYELPEL